MTETEPQVATTIPLRVHRRTLPAAHPLAAYRALRDAYGTDRAFLLESLGGPAADNRFSLCGIAGRAEVVIRRGVVTVSGRADVAAALVAILRERALVADRDGELHLVDDEAFWDVPRAIDDAIVTDDAGDDLAVSVLSFFGYDAARYVEVLPRTIPDAADPPPDAVFSLVDVLVTLGDDAAELAVVETPWAVEDADALAALLADGAHGDDETAPDVPEPRSIVDDITREDYLERGTVCLEHIRVGDIYQVQLGHSITVDTDADALTVYRRLRVRNPSPYMGILTGAGHTIVCASPELFARIEDGQAVMRPIAGTAPRGGDEEATQAALLADPKERAEHLMLVDLCRNDLGRVSQPGSLAVPTLMTIERYSHVFHIVSQVECALVPGSDAYDVIRAGFPAGTMSGAPKVRALEIIESLERTRRGFYAGAFGLIGLQSRQVVLGLAIRMAVLHDSEFVLRASAGFVADSTPEGEWEETLSKLGATYWAVCGKEIRS